jgi:hypothetical protein
MRQTRREKVEVEKQYCVAVNAAQGRAEDMHRIKDEWGVTQALNVRLYAERLTRGLEEARDRLLKVCIFASLCSWSRSKQVDILQTEISFDEKIRSEFDIQLGRGTLT